MSVRRNDMNNILICDDERDIVSALNIYLSGENYNIYNAYTGLEALNIVKKQNIQLILMDIMMPEMDGITAMSKIREISNVPIILLTAKGEDADKILGLTVGADDYITKPFNPMEVTARVRSQLRRYTQLGSNQKPQTDTITVGGIELNDGEKTVLCDGNSVSLTPKEYDILKLLMCNPSRVFSPKEIYEKIWGDYAYGCESTVAVHIRHLREKIEVDPANPRTLKVVWGQGYKVQ